MQDVKNLVGEQVKISHPGMLATENWQKRWHFVQGTTTSPHENSASHRRDTARHTKAYASERLADEQSAVRLRHNPKISIIKIYHLLRKERSVRYPGFENTLEGSCLPLHVMPVPEVQTYVIAIRPHKMNQLQSPPQVPCTPTTTTVAW